MSSSTIASAIAAWESSQNRYEDQLLEDTDPSALESAREELFDAEQAVRTAWRGLVDELRGFPAASPLLRALGDGIEARVRIADHQALEAERRATHGELAGADHDAREQIERLEGARDALSALADAFLDAAVALDQVDG